MKFCGWCCKGEQAETVGRTEASKFTCTQAHLLTPQSPSCPCGFANKSWSPFIFQFQMIAALDTFRSLILRQRIQIFLKSLDLVLMLPNFPGQG